MINVGQTYKLEVVKVVAFGVYVDAEDLGDVLLPRRYVKRELRVGDLVTVFLYLDSEDRPLATTQTPKAEVGEFAYLKVNATGPYGAFLDWGLDKDVLVPFAEQHRPMFVDQSYLVYLYISKADGRIAASSKVDKYVEEGPHEFKAHQAVDLIIANSTDLGFKAIINHSHWGVLYKGEVFERLSFGQSKKGFIKHIRPDGKIDLSLQAGQETRDKHAKIIETYLKKQNGFAPVHDKSDPEMISRLFGMSKAAFKRTIGNLMKRGIITIDPDGIRLTQQ
ncbi:MAG: GntR family transcriptional regulator [Pseudomonadales bacterium]|nr:GntR family transcriptional regulator [Pseudomonadales bacterium]